MTPTDPVAALLASVASFATAYEAAVVPRATALLAQAKAVRDAYAESIPKQRHRRALLRDIFEDKNVASMTSRLINLDRMVAHLQAIVDASEDLRETAWWAQ